ncbi:carbohydrate kinase family protein [Sporosarcina sp. P33]|uniref:carbohydrate kinase family protein n=1 Tax=Sporosarcina sp. P33 TaxID=1930764 RepID=UPI0009BFC945|nr:carbohydrate kinase [Sporosarcina sp. P33]ARD48917.1 fructokinase [Sporosarcina sp. P33]
MNHSQEKHVLIYGDIFVDYIATDETNKEFSTFLGGATVNVAAGVSRLGAKSSLITVFGEDEDSVFAENELRHEGVDLTFAVRVPEKKVNRVYVHLTPERDRVFANYADDTPNIQVKPEDLQEQAFQNASILHICSGTMFQPTAHATTKKAVELAKANGVYLSFDPNVRPLRWESEDICRQTILPFLEQTDLLKLTEEELLFLFEESDVEKALERLAVYQIPVVMMTLGESGTLAIIQGVRRHVAVEPIEPVDTTGAGDAFIAGVLRGLHLHGRPDTLEDMLSHIQFGNQMGALCAMKPGALSAMPHANELD